MFQYFTKYYCINSEKVKEYPLALVDKLALIGIEFMFDLTQIDVLFRTKAQMVRKLI